MHVSLAALCDHAIVDKSDKLSIIGIFTNIGGPQLPLRHRSMNLVVVLQATRADFGRAREVQIHVTDQDGKEMCQRMITQVGVDENAQVPPSANLIIHFEDLVFPTFGPYTFTIYVDGDIRQEVPLNVMPIQMASAEPMS